MIINICDDVPEVCQTVINTLLDGNYLHSGDQLLESHSARELLTQIDKQKPDLLFLDIEMPEMTGVNLLRQNPALFHDIKVVFLTSFTEYVFEGYELSVYRYLEKPIQPDKLTELFQSLEKERIFQRVVSIHSNGIDLSIRVGDILYAEVFNNYCTIVTTRKSWTDYMRLKDLKAKLTDDCFYQVNRSFLINMLHIRHTDWKTGELIMHDGTHIPISRKNRKPFQQSYADFLCSLSYTEKG